MASPQNTKLRVSELSEFIGRVSQVYNIPVQELWELYSPQCNDEKCLFVSKEGFSCQNNKEAPSDRCYRHRIFDSDWPSCKCHNGKSKVHNSKKARELGVCLSCLRKYEQVEFEKTIHQ